MIMTKGLQSKDKSRVSSSFADFKGECAAEGGKSGKNKTRKVFQIVHRAKFSSRSFAPNISRDSAQ